MGRRIITTENLEEDVKIESHLRPQLLEDYIGHRSGKKQGRGTGSCAVLRPAGTWKDNPRRDHCE